jgi:predicted transcriptional regulator
VTDAACPTIGDLAIERFVRIGLSATLRNAARLLAVSGIGTLLVESGDGFVTLTDGDVVRMVAAGADPGLAIGELTLEAPLVANRETTVRAAVQGLVDARCWSVVVVDDDNEPMGLVSLPTLLEALIGGPPWLGALRLALRIEGGPAT